MQLILNAVMANQTQLSKIWKAEDMEAVLLLCSLLFRKSQRDLCFSPPAAALTWIPVSSNSAGLRAKRQSPGPPFCWCVVCVRAGLVQRPGVVAFSLLRLPDHSRGVWFWSQLLPDYRRGRNSFGDPFLHCGFLFLKDWLGGYFFRFPNDSASLYSKPVVHISPTETSCDRFCPLQGASDPHRDPGAHVLCQYVTWGTSKVQMWLLHWHSSCCVLFLEKNLPKITCQFMSFISLSSAFDSDRKWLWSEE